MRPVCLIVDKMHSSIIPLLEELGYTVDYQPEFTRAEILRTIRKATGLIIRNKTYVNSEILDCAPDLKFIARAGAGVDRMDTVTIRARDIEILNAPEGNRMALAEHGLGMLLALLNRITLADNEVRSGVWDRESNRGVNIEGKTVGIIGYGHMGSAFAELLAGFKCEVLAYDKYKIGPFQFAREASLPEIFLRSNILSLHIPLTNETANMVDGEFMRKFNNDIYLLNTARGGIVKETDLLKELESGKILGAALDVLENERIDFLDSKQSKNLKSLAYYPQVIFTPHVAGWSHGSYSKINQVLARKIASLGI